MAIKSDFNDQLDAWAIYRAFSGINDGFTIDQFNDEDMFYWYQAIIAAIPASGAVHFKGFIDASTNPNYPAAVIGDQYEISVKGKIGGASGTPVEVGDLIEANVDTPAGNQATVGANWIITQFGLQQIFEITGSNLSFSVLNNLTQSVGNNYSLGVINDYGITVGNNYSIGVIGNYSGTVGGNYNMAVAGTWAVSGTNFSVANTGIVTINDGSQAVGYVFTCTNVSGAGTWAPLVVTADWKLDGNLNGAEKSLGTKDNFDLPIIVNNVELFRFYKTGQIKVGDSGANVFIGTGSGLLMTTASSNTALGVSSMLSITSGQKNCTLGWQTLQRNTTGSSNLALGVSALSFNSSGNFNVALGEDALLFNSTGVHNIGIGNVSGSSNTVSNYNVSIGFGSLQNNTGTSNCAFGVSSLQANTTGTTNSALGFGAGDHNNGDSNVFIGAFAGRRQTARSNTLFIDNQDRGAAATELTDALIYGIFNATPANQRLNLNAGLIKMNYLTLYANNAAAVGAGLVTGELYMVADVATGSNIIEVVV